MEEQDIDKGNIDRLKKTAYDKRRMIKLVVFLGNPDAKYALTRHNMARMLRKSLPADEAVPWLKKFKGKIACHSAATGFCRFLEPDTGMNLSGESVLAALHFHKIREDELLVVHDDTELAFGKIAWRFGGGMGGHKGLRSIKEKMGTADFWRFRLGIDRPQQGSLQSWVLSPFSSTEKILLPLILESASEHLDLILSGKKAPEADSLMLIQDQPQKARKRI